MNNGTAQQARENMEVFVGDIRLGGITFTLDDDPNEDGDDGRFFFLLKRGWSVVSVEMPGCELSMVRDGDSPWLPRVGVDGLFWPWDFAVNMAAGALFRLED